MTKLNLRLYSILCLLLLNSCQVNTIINGTWELKQIECPKVENIKNSFKNNEPWLKTVNDKAKSTLTITNKKFELTFSIDSNSRITEQGTIEIKNNKIKFITKENIQNNVFFKSCHRRYYYC